MLTSACQTDFKQLQYIVCHFMCVNYDICYLAFNTKYNSRWPNVLHETRRLIIPTKSARHLQGFKFCIRQSALPHQNDLTHLSEHDIQISPIKPLPMIQNSATSPILDQLKAMSDKCLKVQSSFTGLHSGFQTTLTLVNSLEMSFYV